MMLEQISKLKLTFGTNSDRVAALSLIKRLNWQILAREKNA